MAVSTTRWRDDPVIPETYDVASLVPLARKARGLIVEFDWVFTGDELERLRRTAYEWGTPVRGSYRCFDARVLAAINAALNESAPVFTLTEPSGSEGMDCEVSCIRDGEVFRLRGHGPFEVVFGYGVGAAETKWSNYLGTTLRDNLVKAVSLLGWDMWRLGEERFLAVRNAVYGLRLDYGALEVQPAAGPAVEVPVHFHGPFSAFDEDDLRCIFTDELRSAGGVYLWTINVNGEERVWYVGQTQRTFDQRIGEHLAGFLSGEYTTYDAAALSRGEYRRVAGAADDGLWPRTLPIFLRNLESLAPEILALMRLIRFHIAPLERDAQLLSRVEGAIGRHYKMHSDRELAEFFTPGLRIPARIPYDRPTRLLLSSEVPIAGLPTELLE